MMTTPSHNQPNNIFKDNQGDLPPHQQPYRWLILALLWLLYFSFGMVTRSASPLVTPIIHDLEMSYGQMGFVLGSWQMTYIVLAITAGVIMDRWGRKFAYVPCFLIQGVAMAMIPFTTNYTQFVIAGLVIGFGNGRYGFT